MDEPIPTARVPLTEEQLRAVQVGELLPLDRPIVLAAYDPNWPKLFDSEARRVREALVDQVQMLEHVGSTSVPGLAAKPIIDILLVLVDSADEAAYVPAMEAAGYTLRIREPAWHEHRMFKRLDSSLHLHVFSVGCSEIDRMLRFRNWLRNHAADRQLYEDTKRELARQDWKYMQNYADAKSAVVEGVLERASAKPTRVNGGTTGG